VFVAFFPYPAIIFLGNSAGIQLCEALSAIIVLLTLPRLIRARSTLAFVILVVPMVVSLGGLALLGWRGDVDLAIRVAVSLIFALLVLPAAGTLMRNSRTDWLIAPVTVAICIHTFVGVWQYRAFAQGTFPLLAVFRNPSFHDLQDISTSYALYVARPFGLFPEPSAMAASIGPWILFLLWYGLRPGVRRRAMALIGAVAGTLLILLSQSIYAVFLLPCAFLILVAHRRASSRRVSGLELLAWGAAALGMFFFPIISAGRIDVTVNQSTQGRLTSLIDGLGQPFNNLISLFLGIGPGQSPNVMSAQGNGVAAIYSVVVSAFAEGGLIALVAMIIVVRMCLQPRSPSYRYAFLIAWVAGIAFTTSYVSLGPVWVFLAMMLDLELKNESPARDPEFGIGRGRTTPDIAGESAARRQPLTR
jgi:hypothetical protein